jgi:hypothetical protein
MALRQAALEHDFANPLLAQYKAVFKTPYFHDGVLYVDKEKSLYPYDKRTEEVAPWRLNSIYDAIVQNPVLNDAFHNQGFELTFDGVNGQFFVPYFYQAILVGAIGEASIRAILRHHLIATTDNLPDRVFELADLKVVHAPWYIDCKNYSERTMSQFHYSQDDPAYSPQLNERSFIDKAKAKFQQIRDYHHDDVDQCKLIFLNVVSSTDRPKLYFDAHFNEVKNFADAQIIIVQGCIQSADPRHYTAAFEQFVSELKHYFPTESK